MRPREDVQAVLKTGGRYLVVRKNSGEWRLLKGGIEENETEEEALRREIKEEVGISDVKIKEKLDSYEYEAEGVVHKVSSYFVKTNKEELEILEEELKDARWVTVKTLLEKLKYENEKRMVKKALYNRIQSLRSS